MDSDVAEFKTQISVFDNDIANMKNMMDDHDVTVKYNKNAITINHEEITKIKQSCMELAQNTARQTSLLETIEKTRVMCN